MTSLPALYISHGAPTLPLEESPAHRFLEGAAPLWPRPRAIVAVSAHWETEEPEISSAARPETIHDFYGFPEPLYRLRYPAPGAPALAERAAGLLRAAGLRATLDPRQGLDHGAWTPLLLLYPEADIPVLQLSVQSRRDAAHHALVGAALRPLREEGVLLLATGAATHDLRGFRRLPARPALDAPPPDYVRDFADWLAEAVGQGRREDLLDYARLAPHALRNHPTPEHLLPLFVALGAGTPGLPGRILHRSYSHALIAMDCFAFD